MKGLSSRKSIKPFLTWLVVFALTSARSTTASGSMALGVVRGISGHWMAIYAAAMAILYSAVNDDELEHKGKPH